MNIITAIPTLNAAEYLDDCLYSLRHQPPDSILIFDQGSTDATLDIARAHDAVIVNWPESFATAGETKVRTGINSYIAAHYGFDCILYIDADEVMAGDYLEVIRAGMERGRCLRCRYWQLYGSAAWSAAEQPASNNHITAVRSACYAKWVGHNQFHSTLVAPAQHVISEPVLWRIHLGYTGDLRRRFAMNLRRGDYDKDFAIDFQEPWRHLPPVVPTPAALLDASDALKRVYLRHNTQRRIELETGTDSALHIKSIKYEGI